jgi:putative two-component system response regulator
MDNELEQATILVVDDTDANRMLLSEVLEDEGLCVVACSNGQMALDAASRHPPALILLDINMPSMDGFEVCGHLKADPMLRDIPVLFISALMDTADKVKAFAAGGVDYVTKPFQFEEVLARVKTHLNLHRLQLELSRHNQQLEELVKAQVAEISTAQLATIVALARLAESRDDETGHHIGRSQTFCKILAEKLRENPRYTASITDAFLEAIHYASSLHDIGKVGIPDRILLKPGELTPDEFAIMQSHTCIGEDTLRSTYKDYPRNVFLRMGIEIAGAHHECWDGSGYPRGLAGEDIPLSARIMAIADVYDALRSARAYKPAFSHAESVEIILEGASRQFDPGVVEAFKAVEAEFARVRVGMDDGTG